MSLALEILREIRGRGEGHSVPPPLRHYGRCPQGHIKTADNIYHMATGEKLCKACSKTWSKRYYWRNVEQQRARKRKKAA